MNAVITTAAAPSFAGTVWRLVRFDLRRFRWLAVLIVAVEIARAAFVEWAMHLVPAVIGERFGGTFGTQELTLVDAAASLAAVLVMVVLVQADLPADDRAFWRTRPIPPAGLALAKLATAVLLFVAVPVAVNTSRLIAYGASMEAAGAATLQLAVDAGHILLPVWALAVVTRTLPRFCAIAVGLVIGSFMVLSATLYWTEIWWGRGGALVATGARGFVADWQRLYVHGWWFAAGMSAVATSIVCSHYTHRRVGRSTAAVAALLVVSWLLPERHGAPAPAILAGFGSTLRIDGVELPSTRAIEARRSPFPVGVRVALTASGLPADIAAEVRLQRPSFGGLRVVEAGDRVSCCLGNRPEAVVRPAPPVAEHQAIDASLDVAARDLDALRQPSISVDAGVELRFVRHRWIGTLPLRSGAAFRSGRQLIEILAYEPGRRTILVRYTRLPSLEAPTSEWWVFAGPETRTRLSPAWQGWSRTTASRGFAMPYDWARGRSWVGRFDVVLGDGHALAGEPRLYVVESSPAGVTRHRLTAKGVPTGAEFIPPARVP